MAFFKFRQNGDSPHPANRPSESIEVMRQRAKHRLIGSVVLVLAGVVGFPLLFDTQQRPMPVDVQIDIPDKSRAAPLVLSAPADAVKVTAAASLDTKEQLVASDAPSDAPKTKLKEKTDKKEPKALVPSAVVAIQNEADDEPSVPAPPKAKADVRAEPKSKPEPKGTKNTDEGARAKALLDGKDPAPKESNTKVHDDGGRYIIQVGAFAEAAKAQEVRMKLERAGLKTYTHVAETKEGPRTRVRLGPFASKAESDKAAAKVKALGLPAAMLTL